MIVTEAIKRVCGLLKGKITIGCDVINALHEALDYGYRSTSDNQQQFDILGGIHGYLRVSNIIYITKHVKGHKDDNVKLKTWIG